MPVFPPPAQVTDHEMVAVTVKASWGWPADDAVKVCPQVGEAWSGASLAEYGVPGPSHTSVVPSPRSHVTVIGVAVAVTDSPGTAAVAVVGCQSAPASHSQEGSPTSWSAAGDGEASMANPGSVSCLTACCGQRGRGGRRHRPRTGPGVQPHDAAPGAGGVAGAGDEVVATRPSRRWLVSGVAGRRHETGIGLVVAAVGAQPAEGGDGAGDGLSGVSGGGALVAPRRGGAHRLHRPCHRRPRCLSWGGRRQRARTAPDAALDRRNPSVTKRRTNDEQDPEYRARRSRVESGSAGADGLHHQCAHSPHASALLHDGRGGVMTARRVVHQNAARSVFQPMGVVDAVGDRRLYRIGGW